ncbi:glycoside hydrolase family 88 protein [Paenibacillus whitsoniae]|uniref:Uncharacterized protein n=1 Tax=Paenibacillus whitsoniae TaxID=2496558 RepID=A0A3S0CBU1_9BACL|nr:glycoside hydrolase family 88 protein [Paenibacillus whitsoniae]RTE10287.1 hypothetical protein EJQ19_09005 [Paenibacillus whitsoniae]
MESTYKLKREDGLLCTLLKGETSYLEISASALVAYATLKGHRLGYLDAKFRAGGEQITNELFTHHLSEDGSVLHASRSILTALC